MKYMLIGLILLLLVVLWFIPAREGLENQTCWGDVVDASTGKFVDFAEAAMSIRKKYVMTLDDAKAECAASSTCNGVVTGAGPSGSTVYSSYSGNPAVVTVGVAPLPAPGKRMFYPKKACGSPAPPTAAPGCPTNGEGITSVKQSGGQNIRLYTQSECSSLKGSWIGNGARDWGMANDQVGECYGIPGGQNISFCNQTAPPSAAARGVALPPPPPPVVAPPPPPPVVAPPTPVTASSFSDMTLGSFIQLLTNDLKARNPSLLNTANNPAIPVGSLMGQPGPQGPAPVASDWAPPMNGTIPGPSVASMTMRRGAYDEVPKSSLVPCTCPTYAMSCPIHVGSQPSSQIPGDTASALSKAQDQYDFMRPFNNTEKDVPGFLNTFSSFG